MKDFYEKLLDWYLENQRELPWREDPTPYHVWLSEIMLQQTRVEAAREYYLRFLNRLPDVSSLAEASEDTCLKLLPFPYSQHLQEGNTACRCTSAELLP